MSKRWLAAAFALSFLWCPLALAQDAPKGEGEHHWQDQGDWHRKSAQNVTREKLAALPILKQNWL